MTLEEYAKQVASNFYLDPIGRIRIQGSNNVLNIDTLEHLLVKFVNNLDKVDEK